MPTTEIFTHNSDQRHDTRRLIAGLFRVLQRVPYEVLVFKSGSWPTGKDIRFRSSAWQGIKTGPI